MYGRFWLAVQGRETYLFATFITALALFGMFSGKLDYNTGLGIITTMGLGSCIHHKVSDGGDAPAPDHCDHDGGDHS
jgi:hypothetical protein